MASAPDVRHAARFYARSLFEYIQREDVFLWSQAIAFKALVTVIPLLILGTGLAGRSLARVVRELLPPGQGTEVLRFAERLQEASGTLTIVGVIALILAGITLFSTLRAVLANVFAAEWHAHRSIVGGYLFDVRMAAQIGFLFLLTVAVSAAVQAYNISSPEFLARHGLWLNTGWRSLVWLVGFLVPVAITTAIFYQLYYLTPLPHPPKRSVTVGAIFGAVLFEMSKLLFAIYAGRFGGFSRYGGADAAEGISVGSAFGIIIAFVFWAYFSGLVFILGATVVLLHEDRARDGDRAREGVSEKHAAVSTDQAGE